MLLLVWAAAPLPDNAPFMDERLVLAMVLVGLALAGSGRGLGLRRRWERVAPVQASRS